MHRKDNHREEVFGAQDVICHISIGLLPHMLMFGQQKSIAKGGTRKLLRALRGHFAFNTLMRDAEKKVVSYVNQPELPL